MTSEWKTSKLGDLVTFTSGGTPSKKKEEYWNGSIPWISAKTMKTERISTSDLMITEEGLKNGSRLAPEGSILFLIRGSGLFNGIPVCLVEKAVAFNQDVKCITSCSEIENKYIFYWLLSQSRTLSAMVGVTTIGAGKFDMDMIKNLEISYPNPETRHEIVRIADAISKKIHLNTAINENLEQQAQALFDKWVAEHLDCITMRPLTEVAEINPDTYSLKDKWVFVNYLDTSSITNGVMSDLQLINPDTEKLPSRARRIVKANDIVYSTVRPNQLHFGIISNPLDNMLASTGFAVIRSKYDYISSPYIYHFLTSPDFIEKMQQLAEQSTSTFPSVKPSDIGTCLIPCADETEMLDITDKINGMYALVSANHQENKRLAVLRDTLLPKLMNGEIDVSAVKI